MKHRIIIGLLLCLPLLSRAQSPAMEAFYDRYGAAEGITSVALEQKMMHMMSTQAAQRGDAELARLLDEIVFIRVLTTTDETLFAELVSEAEQALKAGKHFDPLTSTTADGRTTRVYLREPKLEENKELVVITHGEDEATVVHIFGSFGLREVSRITSIRPR